MVQPDDEIETTRRRQRDTFRACHSTTNEERQTMKYIIFEIEGIPQVSMFSDTITHLDAAYGVMKGMKSEKRCIELISAGFCNIRAHGSGEGLVVETFGASASLGIESKPEDAETIRVFLEMQSITTPTPQPQLT
jgi:hypothetical protein